MMEKNDIASVLDEIATFMELTGENPFKIRAYSAGARILENMTEDLGELIDGGKLADIPGLGEALVDKITTLRRDGVLPFHQKLKASIPAGLLEVMQIPGLGPKKVRALWTLLAVEDLAKLKEVCESGAVAELKGFGAKTQDKILEGIKNRIAYGKRHRWYEAAAIAGSFAATCFARSTITLACFQVASSCILPSIITAPRPSSPISSTIEASALPITSTVIGSTATATVIRNGEELRLPLRPANGSTRA